MRGYYIPIAGGLLLVASVFLPWIKLGDETMLGFPSVPALWAGGLGVIAVVLAVLSLVTRKNSRHPLLVVGLLALGIMILSWRVLPRSVGDRAQSVSQANAIVEGGDVEATPEALIGIGIYLGTIASAIITLFGLTIVVRRVAVRPYAVASKDDDV
ncbi:MAG TPA: hypothetical protein VN628_02110 [Vicinamibacterales bacterium]|nr:hypothetical protein [Vicinamibacterales bacterium]